jgi:hypothetical protein
MPYSWGGQSPASIPGQVICDLWWTKWCWGMISPTVRFPLPILIPPSDLYIHLSSEAGTIGPVAAGIPPHPTNLITRDHVTIILTFLSGLWVTQIIPILGRNRPIEQAYNPQDFVVIRVQMNIYKADCSFPVAYTNCVPRLRAFHASAFPFVWENCYNATPISDRSTGTAISA